MRAISSLAAAALCLLIAAAGGQEAPEPALPAAPPDSAPPAAVFPEAAPEIQPEPVAAPEEEEAEEEEEEEEVPAVEGPSLSFLIPAEGDVFHTEEVKVVALAQGDAPSGMLLVLDGYSMNRPLRLEEEMLQVDLPGLGPGLHSVKVLFLDAQGLIVLEREVRFFVRLPEPRRKPVKGKLRQFGRVLARMDWKGAEARGRVAKQSELRLQDTVLAVGEGKTPLSQNLDGALEAAYSMKYDHWEGYLKGLLRTDENAFRQPGHRASARLSYGPWAGVRAGDVYPTYNPLILNGTRIRGGEASLALVTDEGERHWMYARAVTGETRREIRPFVAEYDTGQGTRQDTVPGTPAQKLTAFRVGAGGGQAFDLGVTLMRASDHSGDAEFQAINNRLNGLKPVDNLVSGFDLRLGFWDGRIQLYGAWAASLYTRDRSIPAFDDTTSDLTFDAKDLDWLFVINQTTRGWQYFLEGDSLSGRKPDPMGFIRVNSAREAGVTASIPFAGIVSETEVRYSYLGLEYHTEGNPFLGTNPGEGVTFQQRLVVMENRLLFGIEGSSFLQDLGLYRQDERGFKGEVRFLPGAYRPALWINGGFTARAPRGAYPYRFNQDFAQANVGGFHHFVLGSGKLHASLLYGLTRSELELISNDTAPLPVFPVTRTHIVNSALQYKFRGSDLTPKASYTFAYNGVQKSASNAVLGFQDAYFNRQVRLDFDFFVGQYPKSAAENDLSLGQGISAILRLGEAQSVRFREKWIQYGRRASITAGAYYEMFF